MYWFCLILIYSVCTTIFSYPFGFSSLKHQCYCSGINAAAQRKITRQEAKQLSTSMFVDELTGLNLTDMQNKVKQLTLLGHFVFERGSQS